jgi:hypothetical protein
MSPFWGIETAWEWLKMTLRNSRILRQRFAGLDSGR